MDDQNVVSIEQLRRFLGSTEPWVFVPLPEANRYDWVFKKVLHLRYTTLGKPEKGLVRQYIQKITRYSRAQTARLIRRCLKEGKLTRLSDQRHSFARQYSDADIALLAKTDELHDRLSGGAIKQIMEREFSEYGCQEYENIRHISIAHIYNLRGGKTYSKHHAVYTKTKPTPSVIGIRAKPFPDGQPGYIRVDTVHQGDLDGKKGVYHINAVDEVTQLENVVAVSLIEDDQVETALEELMNQFPFRIIEFHSDNGGEFINHKIAALLNRLLIRMTKSRARKTNDNALVEGKNGAIIRKQIGYGHIPQACAALVNTFHRQYTNPYINFHRPCYFPLEITDAKGKVRKVYRYTDMMTPYSKLKSLPNAASYLKSGVTFAMLDAVAQLMSDNQFAERKVNARARLFKAIALAPA